MEFYTETAFNVKFDTKEQRDKALELFRKLQAFSNSDEINSSDEIIDSFLNELRDNDENHDVDIIRVQLNKNDPCDLYFYAGEHANIDVVARVVQFLYIEVNCNQICVMGWAGTANKPVSDGFIGGTTLVSRLDIVHNDEAPWIKKTTEWLEQELKSDIMKKD